MKALGVCDTALEGVQSGEKWWSRSSTSFCCGWIEAWKTARQQKIDREKEEENQKNIAQVKSRQGGILRKREQDGLGIWEGQNVGWSGNEEMEAVHFTSNQCDVKIRKMK